MPHLWEVKHPYYCNEGNFFTNNAGDLEFSSWAGFLEEMGDVDEDLNLVFRWDWQPSSEEDERTTDRLVIFIMGQRKGKFWWCTIEPISRDDEDAVRERLQPRLDRLMQMWEPMAPAVSTQSPSPRSGA